MSGRLEEILKAEPVAAASSVVLAIEVRQAMSGIMPWALIGAEFEPGRDRTLVVEVNHTGDLVAGAPRACIGPLGRALAVGLPREFATAAIGGILRQAERLPAGRLRVNAGGYDDADSSNLSFACAGAVLAHTISAATTGVVSPDTLASAITRCCRDAS